MNNIFTSFFKSQNGEQRKQLMLQDLMRREVELTRDIFGPVPKGVKREFFCLDQNTWVWYEESADEKGRRQAVTTRYVVRPTEILKSQNGGPYQRLKIDEAKNFQKAAHAYRSKVHENLYDTRKKIA